MIQENKDKNTRNIDCSDNESDPVSPENLNPDHGISPNVEIPDEGNNNKDISSNNNETDKDVDDGDIPDMVSTDNSKASEETDGKSDGGIFVPGQGKVLKHKHVDDEETHSEDSDIEDEGTQDNGDTSSQSSTGIGNTIDRIIELNEDIMKIDYNFSVWFKNNQFIYKGSIKNNPYKNDEDLELFNFENASATWENKSPQRDQILKILYCGKKVWTNNQKVSGGYESLYGYVNKTKFKFVKLKDEAEYFPYHWQYLKTNELSTYGRLKSMNFLQGKQKRELFDESVEDWIVCTCFILFFTEITSLGEKID